MEFAGEGAEPEGANSFGGAIGFHAAGGMVFGEQSAGRDGVIFHPTAGMDDGARWVRLESFEHGGGVGEISFEEMGRGALARVDAGGSKQEDGVELLAGERGGNRFGVGASAVKEVISPDAGRVESRRWVTVRPIWSNRRVRCPPRKPLPPTMSA